jgi:hypothetical protein
LSVQPTEHVSEHRVASRGGHSGDGAGARTLVCGLVGMGIDLLTGTGLRLLFSVLFVLGCAVSAAAVRREHLLVPVVAAPLLFTLLALITETLQSSTGSGGWLTQHVLGVGTDLVTKAPVLIVGTVVAGIAALIRRVRPFDR